MHYAHTHVISVFLCCHSCVLREKKIKTSADASVFRTNKRDFLLLEDLFIISVICSNCAGHKFKLDLFKPNFVWLEFGEMMNVFLYF